MKQRKGRKTVVAVLTMLMFITGLMPAWAYGQEPASEPAGSQTNVSQETEDEAQVTEPAEEGEDSEVPAEEEVKEENQGGAENSENSAPAAETEEQEQSGESAEADDSGAIDIGDAVIYFEPEDLRYFIGFEEDSTKEFDYIFKRYSGSGSNAVKIKIVPDDPDDRVWMVRTSQIGAFSINQINELTPGEYTEYLLGVGRTNAAPNYICVGQTEPEGKGMNNPLNLHEEANAVYAVTNETLNLVADLSVGKKAQGLQSIGEEYPLTPEFDSFTESYSVDIPSSLSEIVFSAGIYEAKYSVNGNQYPGDGKTGKNVAIPIGNGTDNPWNEDGEIEVTVEAQVDKLQEYTVTLKAVEVPDITKQPQGTVWYYEKDGDEKLTTISVEAEVAGDGELSYQWYRNDEDSNSGGTAVEGATEASYTVPMPEFNGSLLTKNEYYYCVVTYTAENGVKTEAVSNCSHFVTNPYMEIEIVEEDGSPLPEGGYEYEYTGEPLTGPTVTVKHEEYSGSEQGAFEYTWVDRANGYGNTIGTGKTFTIPIEEGGAYSKEYWCRVTFVAESGEKSSYLVSGNSVKITKTSNLRTPEVSIKAQPEGGIYQKGDIPTLKVEAAVNGGNGEVELYYQWQRSVDGEEFADIESYVAYDNYQTGTQYKRADQSSYTSESDSTDAYYRCVVTAVSTEEDGTVYESEPAYSEAAHIQYEDIFDMKGSGTEEDPYKIANVGDLIAVKEKVNKDGNSLRGVYFEITGAITLPGDWEPIGASKDAAFSGNIDGGGNLLTVPEGGLPLLGHTSEATLKNLDIYGEKIAGYGVVQNYNVDRTGNYKIIIDNVNLKSGTQTLMSGYIGGYASGVDEVIIRNCTVEKDVVIGYDKNQGFIGSFAGEFNGYIENCVSYATVYGLDNVGGIMARKGQSMGPCRISNCEFYGEVIAAGEHAGGILASGYVASSAPNTPCASVENCAVYGTVEGKDHVGGIFGGEPGVLQCWGNGIGYIRDNWFGGTIESDGKYVGAIIGYMNSLDRYNVVENNYYSSDCGVDRGIGGIARIDTSCATVDKSDTGVTYVDTSDAGEGKSYNRTDDPLGADKEKLTKAVSPADGASALNSGRENSYGNWTVGENGQPVHSEDESVPYRIALKDIYPTTTYQGEALDLSGVDFVVYYTDGTQKTVDGSLFTVSGYDSDKVKTSQEVTLQYGGAFVKISVTVLSRDQGDITVTFSLLGDENHGDEGDTHTLADNNLKVWIEKDEYTVDGDATVLDLMDEALEDYNEEHPDSQITYENPTGNYIESVTNGPLTLAEFDNGANSGWMYTLNGVHSDLGVAEQYLENGDDVVFHYTDDYTKESAIEAVVRPSDVMDMIDGIGEVTLDKEDAIREIKAAYDALSDADKEQVTNYQTLEYALTKLEELKAALEEEPQEPDDEKDVGEMDKDVQKAYQDTGRYLSNMAEETTPVISSTGGEWLILGLARSEYDVSDDLYSKYMANVIKTLEENDGVLDERKYTEYSRVVLALTAIGEDVTDVAGYDLLEPLADFDQVKFQGINGPIFALMAFDAHDYDIPEKTAGETQTTRELLIEYILDCEINGGGWALSGTAADPDITAMAIQSLAPYYDSDADVKEAVDKAVEKLSQIQKSDGGFASWGTVNSESCAQVIVALTALGIDPDEDERFIKNGRSVVDAMMTFAVDGGGFRHVSSGSVNGMATEQAYYALAAYDRFLQGKTSLYDMTDISFKTSAEQVKEAETLISAIGDPVTLEDKDAVNRAVMYYNSLDDNVKEKIDAQMVEKLMKAEEAIYRLEIENVEKLIDAIGEVSLDSEKAITEAREAYNLLSDEQKQEVKNYEILEKAIKRLVELKKEADSPKRAAAEAKASGAARSVTKTANVTLGELSQEARAVVDGMSEAIAAIAAADPKDASEYTEEQINLVTEVYKAYNELELVDKTAVEATDEWKTFSEITAGIGRLYHYDEVAGIDMRDNGEEALPWYVKLSASPKTLSEAQEEDIRNILGEESQVLTMNDIMLVNSLDGSQWHPKELVKVAMPMADTGEYESAVIVHIEDGGDIELIEGEVSEDGEIITFMASDFSLYGIAGSMESIDSLLGAQAAAEIWPWIAAAAAAAIIVVVIIGLRRRASRNKAA